MKEILLIGDGGHCKSVIDVIEQEGKFSIAGIVTDKNSKVTNVLGHKVIGDDLKLPNLSNIYKYALITVGQIYSSETRVRLFTLLTDLGYILPSIISPRAYVSKHARIGSGTIIMHDALVNANAIVRDNCIINSKAIIEHDSIINNHCHISTNATVNGNVVVEKGCFIGSGATTKNSIEIKKNSFFKAGTLIK